MKSIFQKALNYLTGNTELKEKLNKVEQKLEELTSDRKEDVITVEPVCKNRIIYNAATKFVTVVDCNNDTFSGEVEKDVVELLKTADTREIIRLLTPKKVESKGSDFDIEKEEKEIVKPFLGIFEGVDDFEVVGDKLFFKNIRSVEIPSLIAAAFVKLIEKHRDYVDGQIQTGYLVEDETYQSLKMFTLKLLLNPLEESRNQLLTFVRNNSIQVSRFGNLVLYRACYESNESNELVKFVAKEYLKLKAWKKAPRNYEVYDTVEGLKATDKGEIYQDDYKGNLAKLYEELPKLQEKGKQYYSSHGKKKIVIGDVYKIEDEEVDLNADVCHAGGLHAASVDYDYSSYGNVNLVVLINPAKTITVPTYDIGKMRVSEMMIVGINPNPQGVPISEDFYCDLDDNYHNYSIEELENALQTKSLGVTSVSDAVSEVSLKEVQNITNLLKNRVINL